MPSAFRGARPSHPRRACGRRAPLVLGGWMHGFPAPCPGGHPRIRRPPPRRAATFSPRNGTKRQFGTAQGRLSGSLGLSRPRRRPKTPGRGRPPFPRGRGHRTKPPFCATSGRKGGGATPGTRSRRVPPPRAPPRGGALRARAARGAPRGLAPPPRGGRPSRPLPTPRGLASIPAPARAPLPPGGPCALGATSPACGLMPGRGRAPATRHELPSKGPRHMPGPLARAIGCPA